MSNETRGPEVGIETPTGKIHRGFYTGSSPMLIGEQALICESNDERDGWIIQLDNRNKVGAFGWWFFPRSDWKILEYDEQKGSNKCIE